MKLQNLISLRNEVYAINKANGWHEKEREFHDDINLIHSEISEAYEDYRNDKGVNEVWYEYKRSELQGPTNEGIMTSLKKEEYSYAGDKLVLGKPCGIPTELADIIIRILDTDNLHSLGVVEHYEIAAFGTLGLDRFELPHLIYSLHINLHLENANEVVDLGYMIHIIVHFCQNNNINLDGVIREKLEYNKTRGYKHGGKVI